MSELERCRTCGVAKYQDSFWRQDSKKNGLQSECKQCMRERNNKWQRNNRETRHPQKLAQVYRARRLDPRKMWFYGARARAASNNLDFDLSLEDFTIPTQCPVLGIPIRSELGKTKKPGGGRDNSPSIDRIDNHKGYTADNTVIVSYRANRLKSDASIEELRRVADWYEREATLATIARTRHRNGLSPIRGEQPLVSAMLALPA